MNYRKIIEQLPIFKNSNIAVKPLAGGLTNANFVVVDGRNKYVARFGFESNKRLGLNKVNAVHNFKAASKLRIGPEFIAYYPKVDMLLSKYLEGHVVSNRLAKTPTVIRKTAKLLRKTHEELKFKGRFDPFVVSEGYFKLLGKSKSWFPKEAQGLPGELKKLKARFGQVSFSSACHLDLFGPNILINRNKIHFLDWDYSAQSDYRFDLATLSSMENFGPEQDRLLIKAYGRNNLTQAQLNLAKAIMLIREVGWDLVQVKFSNIDFDYKKYTRDNLKKYHKVMKLL